MTNTNTNTNTSMTDLMRGMLGKAMITAQPTPTAQNAQEGTQQPPHRAQPDVSQQMRDLRHGGQQRPDPGMIAFVEAAQRQKAKDPMALYRAAGDRVIVNQLGDVCGSVDDLVTELRRENPAQFGRQVPSADAGATGSVYAGGIGGGDMARAALDITRSGRG